MRKIFIDIIHHKLKPLTAKFTEGLTINNLNKFVVRHFEDQALSGLKPNSDKTVINPSLKAGVSLPAPTHLITPALRLGLVGTPSYRGFSPNGTATCLRADSL